VSGALARISLSIPSSNAISGTNSSVVSREQTGQTFLPAAISALVLSLKNEIVSCRAIKINVKLKMDIGKLKKSFHVIKKKI
jgi:hypothetical protein